MNKFIMLIIIMTSIISCRSDEVKNEKTSKKEHLENSTLEQCPNYILKEKANNLNLSIFIDLSDRIDNDNHVYNDSAYIQSIAKSFNKHIKGKKLGLLHDNMEVFFDPAPSNPEINKLSALLKVSYTKGVSKNVWIPKTTQLYRSAPSKIFSLAKNSGKTNGYPGSDLWGFMKNHIKDYCIDSCSRNILIILTDGYMYHEESKQKKGNRTSYLTPQSLARLQLNRNDWLEVFDKKDYGFIPSTTGLQDLEVLVLGISDQNLKNPYSKDIIDIYWKRWLSEMGVKNLKVKNADIPSSIEKVIADFIENK